MTATQIIGRLVPWALAAAAAFMKEVLLMDIGWWPMFSSLATGVVQFIISMLGKGRTK